MAERKTDDQEFIRSSIRPDAPGSPSLAVVDLFAGCGGMTVGLWEAARRAGYGLDIPLAVEIDPRYEAVYGKNFPSARVQCTGVETLFPGEVGDRLSPEERILASEVGAIDILVGGPPCQGHSDLNNWTRRRDPRNQLYLKMARAAAVLEPRVVIIENVTAVTADAGDIVGQTQEALEKQGYTTASRVIDMHRLGLPQRRRRHLVLATLVRSLNPDALLDAVSAQEVVGRDVRWAIDDLATISEANLMDTPSKMTPVNRARADFLVRNDLYDLPDSQRPQCHRDGGHTYKSMYGRLHWDRPAQTITSGFGSMGQGRYLHPDGRRTLTPHEAARLQSIPDWFDFGEAIQRTSLATMIGNAVPPLLMVRLGEHLLPALQGPVAK